MQKLRTRLTEKHTHTYIHTHGTLDPIGQTENPGIWAALVACLSRGPELSIQVLDKGLQRRVRHFRSVREGNGSGRPGSLQPLGTKLCQDTLLGLVAGSKEGQEVSHPGQELKPQWLEMGEGMVSNKRGQTGSVELGERDPSRDCHMQQTLKK